ncbi:hypothetical protein WJX73_001848 [Symbiochloris irregularis]|uniref:BRCT domain-containing protein n=1 Tax=Symbiochloris irregularis TaxID=706552 RepID=A0AAW1NVI9_9CHLO
MLVATDDDGQRFLDACQLDFSPFVEVVHLHDKRASRCDYALAMTKSGTARHWALDNSKRLLSLVWLLDCTQAGPCDMGTDRVYAPNLPSAVSGAEGLLVTTTGIQEPQRTAILQLLATLGVATSRSMPVGRVTHVIAGDVTAETDKLKIVEMVSQAPVCRHIHRVNPVWAYDCKRYKQIVLPDSYSDNLPEACDPCRGVPATFARLPDRMVTRVPDSPPPTQTFNERRTAPAAAPPEASSVQNWQRQVEELQQELAITVAAHEAELEADANELAGVQANVERVSASLRAKDEELAQTAHKAAQAAQAAQKEVQALTAGKTALQGEVSMAAISSELSLRMARLNLNTKDLEVGQSRDRLQESTVQLRSRGIQSGCYAKKDEAEHQAEHQDRSQGGLQAQPQAEPHDGPQAELPAQPQGQPQDEHQAEPHDGPDDGDAPRVPQFKPRLRKANGLDPMHGYYWNKSVGLWQVQVFFKNKAHTSKPARFHAEEEAAEEAWNLWASLMHRAKKNIPNPKPPLEAVAEA